MTLREALSAFQEGKLSEVQLRATIAASREWTKIPLSESQKGLLYLQQAYPHSAAYNVPVCCRLRGEIDREKFRQACQALVQVYPILAGGVNVEEGFVCQANSG